MTAESLNQFTSVRYIKNGSGAGWWNTAKAENQIHAGWSDLEGEAILAADIPRIARLTKDRYGARRGATNEINQIAMLLQHPSQHIWITFEDGYLWWCTVQDGAILNPNSQSKEKGHFWLECDRPWSKYSLDGTLLAKALLPGTVATTAGFKGTACRPQAEQQILRIIRGEVDPDVEAAVTAHQAYEDAIGRLIGRLGDRDFELLIDLILARSGWVRVAKLGGVEEGVDIEAENIAVQELAFVQIKSTATQSVLADYVDRFNQRRDRYARMIFVAHQGVLRPPEDPAVQVWTRKRVANLAVHLGLGTWLQMRI